MSHKSFRTLQRAADKFGETNDCTVKAWAVAAGLEYWQAHRDLRAVGRREGRGIRMREVLDTLCDMYDLEAVEETRFTSKTVVTLERELPKRGIFLIFVSGHVLCHRAGKVHDWTQGRRHRVQQVFRIRRRK